MKMIAVNLQVPEKVDSYYQREATRRMVSKSAVMREALMEKMERVKKAEAKAEPVPA